MYTITSRRTMLGFHKMNYKDNIDRHCTKTQLLFFQKENDAKDVASIMEMSQGKIARFERDVDFTDGMRAMLQNVQENSIEGEHADSLKPINIEMVPYSYLEKLCILHFFDMLIVYNQKIKKEDDKGYEIVMDCYEYRTLEYPNRIIQEKMFRDMLYLGG